MLRARIGFTVLELVVALLIGTIVLTMLASLSARQQGLAAELGLAAAREEQLQQTEGLLPVELRSVSPSEGDISAGNARDTAVQFRATIATGIVCDTASLSVSLAPVLISPVLTSILRAPVAGDTLWSLSVSDTGEQWVSSPITGVAADHGGCVLGGMDVLNGATGMPRTVLRLSAVPGSPPPTPGTPVRVTRPERLSLYRSSDGRWYLGDRAWNPGSGKFDAIQPVSGPFQTPARAGITMRFLDSLGGAIASGSANTRSIALIQVSMISDSDAVNPGRRVFAGESRALLSIAIRNRVR